MALQPSPPGLPLFHPLLLLTRPQGVGRAPHPVPGSRCCLPPPPRVPQPQALERGWPCSLGRGGPSPRPLLQSSPDSFPQSTAIFQGQHGPCIRPAKTEKFPQPAQSRA